MIVLLVAMLATLFNVRDFGAVGDCVHDDTAAVQATIEHAKKQRGTVYFPSGEYVVNSVFLYDGVSVVGEDCETTVLHSPKKLSHSRWWNIGYSQYQDRTGDTWSGVIRNLSFVLNGECDEMLHVARSKNAMIEHCKLASNGKAKLRLLAIGYNNASYLNDGGHTPKDGITVSQCVFDCSGSVSSESIGMGDDYKNVKILNNTIINQSDDLGIHRCQNVLISGNYITATDGRILISDSYGVTVADNVIEYTDTNEAGMGILVFSESRGIPKVCRDIVISNNQVRYRSPLNNRSSAYGIRLLSGRNVIVSGNLVSSETDIPGVGIISVETQSFPGWKCPDAIDPDGEPRLRNVVIASNIAKALIVQNADNEGPIILTANMTDSISDADLRAAVNYSGNVFQRVGTIQPTHKTNAFCVQAEKWTVESHSRLLRVVSEKPGRVAVSVNGQERFNILLKPSGEKFVGYFNKDNSALVEEGDEISICHDNDESQTSLVIFKGSL